MALGTMKELTESKTVGMGQIAVAQAPARLASVLGSCVGVALFHPRLRLGCLAHVVLPRSNGVAATPGKFADTAIPHMLQLLEKQGANRAGLVVKICGGACMFNTTGPLQIGDANIEAVTAVLAAEGLRVAARDVGGTAGRRITMDCDSGQLTIDTAGNHSRIL
jgi:chemotaxis protein CheD